jgi:serine/threonine protein kinase
MSSEESHKNISPKSSQKKGSAKELPSAIGPYKVDGLLRKGGMSLLYLGHHPKTQRPLAIKVLSPQLLANKKVVKHFLEEAKIIAITNHPNIVQLFGHGEWEKGLYIAMEFIQGISLRQFIVSKALSVQRSLEVVLEVASALKHLHTHNVIHRDLKPENILLRESGHIKVIDFGIAQVLQEDGDPTDTGIGSGSFLGTPSYMSPEQQKNPESVTFASDIYSLGVIAYELISGRLSHGLIQLSFVPKGLQKILAKCLQEDPKDRYQDMIDLILDVATYRNTLSPSKPLHKKETDSTIEGYLRDAQATLLPSALPEWSKVDMGLFNHRTNLLTGIYFDFFPLSEGRLGIVMSEPTSTGAEAILHSAVVRGMIRTLSQVTMHPVQLAALLNQLLITDSMDQIFTLSYLILNPLKNQLSYLSCGSGSMWMIPMGSNTPKKVSANNIALGITAESEFVEVTRGWYVGDTLLLNSSSTAISSSANSEQEPFQEKQFEAALSESYYLSPQKQVQALFHRLRANSAQPGEMRALTFISVKRTA